MNNPLSNQVARVKPLFDYLKKQQENQKFVKTVENTATFTLISFFLFFAIRPTFLTISSLVGEIKSKQLLKTELRQKINDVIKAQELFSEVQQKYQIVDTGLPDRPKFYDAAYQIRQAGQSLGVPVDTISFGLSTQDTPQPDPNLKSFTVSLSLNGQFLPAMQLVDKLLQNRRLINIEAFNVLGDRDETISTDSAKIVSGVNTGFASSFYYWSPPNEKK